MARLKFTKKDVAALPPAENDRGQKYYDTEMRTLGLVVYPSGRKVFFITYGSKGRCKQMTLGDFGSITVEGWPFGSGRTRITMMSSTPREHPREDKRCLGIDNANHDHETPCHHSKENSLTYAYE
ncbi:Arm DNA-binding domain-containing protein [bacterium]|nr:Arm DNA-binding domain-containing protein [bacterium]